jgi:hypothetical protein
MNDMAWSSISIRRLQLHNFGCGMTATPVHATIIHTGGTRAYVAEGAEIPGQARPFVEKMIQAEHKLAPDALARQPKPAKILDVKDTLSLKDETVEINLYNIPNPHVDGMVIGHVVGPNVVWVTDLISPRWHSTFDLWCRHDHHPCHRCRPDYRDCPWGCSAGWDDNEGHSAGRLRASSQGVEGW